MLSIKKILHSFEIILSIFVIIFLAFKIAGFFAFPKYYPEVKDNAIYLTGILNKESKDFLNLISFDYKRFVSDLPQWNEKKFHKVMKANSLIITKYQLDDFSNIILNLRFPYWEKKAVKISIKIDGKWLPLNKLISFNLLNYSLEDIVFLGLGMEKLNIQGISEKEFIFSYFKNKGFKIKDKSLLKLKRTTLRLSLK